VTNDNKAGMARARYQLGTSDSPDAGRINLRLSVPTAEYSTGFGSGSEAPIEISMRTSVPWL